MRTAADTATKGGDVLTAAVEPIAGRQVPHIICARESKKD